ncbi:MAG TPA: DUF881 domain-containing protein [Candidatus Nanopelagicales bacterium]|nr:DUF881 domain-containing protein [Candidatus Nanopelagicales bacterium]
MTTLSSRVRAIPSWQVALCGALIALGFLITAQVRSETPRVRYTTQERAPLVGAVVALQAQQKALTDRILELRTKVTATEQGAAGSDVLVSDLNAALRAARVAAGLVALEGPGIYLQLEDSQVPVAPGGSVADYRVGARDLRLVVEELWLAGAEAVSVNGERLVPASAFVDIGGTLLVNSAYLAPPYQVAAIGPPDLYDVLVTSPGFIELVEARADRFGIRISFAEPDRVTIPAYAGTVTLRYARPPAPSPTPEP